MPLNYAQKDVFIRTMKIFQNIKGSKDKVFLKFNQGNGSFITHKTGQYGGYYLIQVDENSKHCKPYVIGEHEFSHWMNDSPVKFMQQILTALTKDIENGVDNNIAMNLIKYCFNVIEDQRVDSIYGSVYPGFESAREEMKEKWNEVKKIENPLDAIMCARMSKFDMVNKSEWPEAEEYIQNVVLKDRAAGVLLTKKYWEQVVQPWMKENISRDEPKTPQPQEENGETQETKGSKKSQQNKKSKNSKKPKKTLAQKDEARKKLSQTISKIKKMAGDHDDYKEQEPIEIDVDVTKDEEKMEKALQQSNKEQQFQTQQFKNQLEQLQYAKPKNSKTVPNVEGEVKQIKRQSEKVEPDLVLANQLNRTFRTLKGKYTQTLDEDGSQIDMDEWIQFKVTKKGPVFEDEKLDTGMAVVIMVDCSGSMTYNKKIQTARNVCGTLFTSLKNIDNVQLQVIGFSAPNEKFGISVTKMTKIEDLKCLTVTNGHMLTPTHLAIQYGTQILKEMRGTKKLMIMLTDGHPEMTTQGRSVNMKWLIKQAQQAVRKSKLSGITINSLFIEGGLNNKEMTEIFGHGFISVKDMEHAASVLSSQFRRQVVQQIKVK